MSEVPRGWSVERLDTLADFVMGQAPPGSECNRDGVGTPFVKAGEFGVERPVIREWTTRPLKHALASDVLICVVGATAGKINLGADCAIGRSVAAIRPNRAIDQAFLYRLLSTKVLALRAGSVGSAQGVISKENLSEIAVWLPPVPEQARIVARIDSLTGRSRRARDHLDHIPRLVEKYKQAVLAAAFRGDLTQEWRTKHQVRESASELVASTPQPPQSRGGREATTNIKAGVAGLAVNNPETSPPEGWAWVPLRRVSRQETGHTPSRSKPEYWDGGIPWIGIRDAGAHHGSTINETMQTISEAGLANSSARLLPAGTVCLSRTASIGYVTIMGRSMATSQDFATWTCSAALLPKYLMYALMAEGERIRDFGEGSTHTTIYFPEIRALHICLAPLEEQHEIVRRVERALAWIERLGSEAESAQKLIERLDQAVLAKAFRGELVPQNPSDEPASVLLERVMTERSATPKGRRGRRPRASE